MLKLLVLIPIALVAACSEHDATEAHTAPMSSTAAMKDGALTAMDQSNAKSDLSHLAEIRKAIEADDTLSMAAKNVTVLTKSGVVTLRGTVASAAERARVEQLAHQCPATKSVDDQLTVEAK